MDPLAALVSRDGCTRLGADLWAGGVSAEDAAEFSAFWDDLELDVNNPVGVRCRYRRYGRMRVTVAGDDVTFDVLPNASFRQDSIQLWAGQERTFAPALPATLLHPVMRTLVGFDARLGTALSGNTRWEIGLHLIRIVAERDVDGVPTPEGRHRDGHMYIGMHLLRRTGCVGGESTIHLVGGGAATFTLEQPLDGVFVDDDRVTHEVSMITAVEPVAVRDMLLVDLNPA